MREIKFRGKRVDNGEWGFGFLVISETSYNDNQYCIIDQKNHFGLSSTKNGNLCFSESDTRVHHVIPETVGQFTGLFDKNGTPIYEGDCFNGSLDNTHVCWCDECKQFQLIITDMNECLSCLGDYHWAEFVADEDIEIIGNIHDNPELLEVKL